VPVDLAAASHPPCQQPACSPNVLACMVRVRGVTVSYLRPGEGLGLRCAHCNRTRVLSRDDLIRLVGGGGELDTLHTRLRCAVRLRHPADMWITTSG
jgi:hypothetical protein